MNESNKNVAPNNGPWTSRSIICTKFTTDGFKPPPNFTFTLRKHQEVGVNWMRMREIDPPGAMPMRGGILADDMGLGKTIQLLALLAYDKNNLNTLKMQYTYKDSLHEPLDDEYDTFQDLNTHLTQHRKAMFDL